MYEIQKIKLPEKIETYEFILTEAAKKNWSFTSEKFGYLWFERKMSTKKTTKNLEDTILYQENLELWKKWTPKLRESYKTFRKERYAQHKDYVSYGAEKLLINKINKYSESISIKLMQASSGYKSIVEHENIITAGRTQQQIEENRAIEDRKQIEQQKALQDRKKQDKAIINSGQPKEYWEEQAMSQLRTKYPKYTNAMLKGFLNPRIRTILTEQGFL